MDPNSSILQDDFIIHLSDTFTFDRSTFRSICGSDSMCSTATSHHSREEEEEYSEHISFRRTHPKILEPQKYHNKSLYQKRFNKLILNIDNISFFDKLKLKLIH